MSDIAGKVNLSFKGLFKVDYDPEMKCLVLIYEDGEKIYLDCSKYKK